jgi:hypothetical protein
MAHVVRSFHPEARVPEGEAELAGLYHSVLHGKRVFLLMDNAAGRPQVEPLLPPRGCALLVTSRFRFSLPGLAAQDLDELPDADACVLLRRIAPRIGDEAADLARLCGGLPLALRLAGSALADRPDFTPAAYARRLAEAKERFGEVEASLALSYELLSAALQRLWRALAVFPGTFDAPAAAATWALERTAAEDALGSLVTSSLVAWEATVQRYRQHDLARLSADHRLEDAERAAAQQRHAAHFLEVLRRADSLFDKGGDSLKRGLSLFDAEWDNIRTGWAWTAAQPRDNREAAALCSGYPDLGTFFLPLRFHPKEEIRWREAALAAARHREDRKARRLQAGTSGRSTRNRATSCGPSS